MPLMIQARGLVKRFGDFTAVNGIDFAVEPGEFFGFLGPNGAGKTSTIRMISCAMPHTAGELFVDGLDVRSDDRAIKSRLGIVPQDNNLDEDLGVRKNLEVYARYFDLPKAVAAERIAEGLALMHLSDRVDSPIRALSGGMRRRLVIARALLNQPRILILDEPTTGLDPQARHLVWDKLNTLRAAGVTVIITTHYMEEAEHLCDRLVIMDQGHILDSGRPRDLIERIAGKNVLEARPLGDEHARITTALSSVVSNGQRLERSDSALYLYDPSEDQARAIEAIVSDRYRYTLRRTNLEDVFLALTGRVLVE